MDVIEADTIIELHGLAYFRELSTFGALPDEAIIDILRNGAIKQYKQGEYRDHLGTATEFYVILQGKMAFYKHHENQDTLTRNFTKGEQAGFDVMIGLMENNGTDVAEEDSILIEISSTQFFNLHVNFPEAFGILMINLTRELAREIAMLENVIGQSSGWNKES